MHLGEIILRFFRKFGELLHRLWFHDYSALTEPIIFGYCMLDIIVFFAFVYFIIKSFGVVFHLIEHGLRDVIRSVIHSLWNLFFNLVSMFTKWFFRRVFATIEYLTGKAIAHTWRHQWEVRYERFRALFQKPEEGWSFFPKQSSQNPT